MVQIYKAGMGDSNSDDMPNNGARARCGEDGYREDDGCSSPGGGD